MNFSPKCKNLLRTDLSTDVRQEDRDGRPEDEEPDFIRVESRWRNGDFAGARRQGRSLFAVAGRPHVNHVHREERLAAFSDRIATRSVDERSRTKVTGTRFDRKVTRFRRGRDCKRSRSMSRGVIDANLGRRNSTLIVLRSRKMRFSRRTCRVHAC